MSHLENNEMAEGKTDYLKGMFYFACLTFCICLCFTMPDKDTVFYKILWLFGINPGIRLWSGGTLYIYMLIPLILIVLCVRKVIKYWWSYGLRFKEYNLLLRYFPAIAIAGIIFVSSSLVVSPSITDRIYYAVLGQRGGLKSITYHAGSDYNNLRYEFNDNKWTYSCDLEFENHGNEIMEFYVKLKSVRFQGFPDSFIRDTNGEKMLFVLMPKQKICYSSEFTEYHQTEYSSGSGSGVGIFDVVLINDDEAYAPKPIIR